MTETEDKRFARRRAVFVNEGLSQEDADDLAFGLMMRDRDPFDDRRICFECRNYISKMCLAIKDKTGKPTQQLRFILQRCDFFKLKDTK